MKHGDGGKTDERRPGKGYDEGYDRIWGKKAPEAPAEEDKEDDDE